MSCSPARRRRAAASATLAAVVFICALLALLSAAPHTAGARGASAARQKPTPVQRPRRVGGTTPAATPEADAPSSVPSRTPPACNLPQDTRELFNRIGFVQEFKIVAPFLGQDIAVA